MGVLSSNMIILGGSRAEKVENHWFNAVNMNIAFTVVKCWLISQLLRSSGTQTSLTRDSSTK